MHRAEGWSQTVKPRRRDDDTPANGLGTGREFGQHSSNPIRGNTGIGIGGRDDAIDPGELESLARVVEERTPRVTDVCPLGRKGFFPDPQLQVGKLRCVTAHNVGRVVSAIVGEHGNVVASWIEGITVAVDLAAQGIERGFDRQRFVFRRNDDPDLRDA